MESQGANFSLLTGYLLGVVLLFVTQVEQLLKKIIDCFKLVLSDFLLLALTTPCEL